MSATGVEQVACKHAATFSGDSRERIMIERHSNDALEDSLMKSQKAEKITFFDCFLLSNRIHEELSCILKVKKIS